MGIHIFGNRNSSCSHESSSCGHKGVVGPIVPAPNMPNPRNFVIERLDDQGDWTLVMARYPDATNYEGRKILVYRHPAEVIRSQKVLDPHFCDGAECISPFARFEPTEQGWLAAYLLVKAMKDVRILEGRKK